MNIKRAFLVLAAALLMPGLALAQEATFVVDFNFEDGNDWDTSVARISCNGGLPLNNQQVVSNGSTITFVLTFADAGAGAEECVITVDPVSGYTAQYLAIRGGIPDVDISLINCLFNDIIPDDVNGCEIDMDLDPVTVAVTKEWVVDRTGGDVIDPFTRIEVSSDAPIYNEFIGEDPYFHYCGIKHDGSEQNGLMEPMYCLTLNFDGEETEFFYVIPSHDGEVVYFYEDVVDSAVEVSNTCGIGNAGAVTVFPGKGADCTFINTVFFEGIPTLNQYGLAIMALLMLGVGFVGFRRFV